MSKKLGLTRTEFICQAIAQELINHEEQEMAKSMMAMKQSKDYMAESNELTECFSDLPNNKNEWWKKRNLDLGLKLAD